MLNIRNWEIKPWRATSPIKNKEKERRQLLRRVTKIKDGCSGRTEEVRVLSIQKQPCS